MTERPPGTGPCRDWSRPRGRLASLRGYVFLIFELTGVGFSIPHPHLPLHSKCHDMRGAPPCCRCLWFPVVASPVQGEALHLGQCWHRTLLRVSSSRGHPPSGHAAWLSLLHTNKHMSHPFTGPLSTLFHIAMSFGGLSRAKGLFLARTFRRATVSSFSENTLVLCGPQISSRRKGSKKRF